MADDRKRAIALKAADARALLQKDLPYVLHVLTPAQLAQVQRVLDAEVINPEVAKQANEVYRKSVTAQSGNLVLRDQKTVDRAYRIMATQIKASESDQHIRLGYKRLLTVDALTPVTDNPDERE
jgi:NADH dehydrogenase FAD-containing subunit